MSLRYKQTPFGTEIVGLVEALAGISTTEKESPIMGERNTPGGFWDTKEKENAVREDNWMHKSACMRCLTCAFFVPKAKTSSTLLDDPVLGRCRKHAPTMNGWPAVFENDWCGDHKLDENKLDAHLALQRPKDGLAQGACRIPNQERKEDR
jgi:hypothetical protein